MSGTWRRGGAPVRRWWDCKLAQPLWETVRGPLKTLKTRPPRDSVTPLPGVHPQEANDAPGREACTPCSPRRPSRQPCVDTAQVLRVPGRMNRQVTRGITDTHTWVLSVGEEGGTLALRDKQVNLGGAVLREISQTDPVGPHLHVEPKHLKRRAHRGRD